MTVPVTVPTTTTAMPATTATTTPIGTGGRRRRRRAALGAAGPLLTVAILLASSVVPAAVSSSSSEVDFSYDPYSDIGPSHWKDLQVEDNQCGGSSNSPVALETKPCTSRANYKFTVREFVGRVPGLA
jgi:hypothetical protein